MFNNKLLTFKSVSNYLIIVALLLVVSCQKNGNSSLTGSEEPEDEVITASFQSEDSLFIPGEIILIDVRGHSLTQDEYDAELESGESVFLQKNTEDDTNSSLVFIAQEVNVGENQLIFSLNEEELHLNFATDEYEIIEEPDVYVLDKSEEIKDSLFASLESYADEAVINKIEETIQGFEAALIEFESLPYEEQKIIARIIDTNLFLNNSGKSKSSNIFQGCAEQTNSLNNSSRDIAKSATVGASTNRSFLSYFTLSNIFRQLSNLIDEIDLYISGCVAPELDLDSIDSKRKAADLLFIHNEQQNLKLRKVLVLDEPVKDIIADVREDISSSLSFLPSSWINYLDEVLVGEIEEEVDVDLYELTQISSSIIESEVTGEGSVASISFNFKTDELVDPEGIDFSFSLKDENEELYEIEATLNPPLPVSFGEGSIPISIGETLTDTMDASFANYFEIIEQPEQGTVVLTNSVEGIFTYTPNSDFEDGDSFTFNAQNATGTSEEATVGVVDKNELPFLMGYYEVTYAWGVKLLLRIDRNVYRYSRGRIFYFSTVENEYYYAGFNISFTAYLRYNANENPARYISVSINAGGCLSENFKLYDFDESKQHYSGTYTNSRCHYEDEEGSEVKVKYLGTSY